MSVDKKARRGKYMISAVAQKYNIHPQTLRLYEREGLLTPSRTDGNTRLYAEEDLEQLETILSLTRDLGVNLAGVQVILNLLERMEDQQERMEDQQERMEEMKEFIRREMWTLLKEKYGETSTALTPVAHQGVVPFRRSGRDPVKTAVPRPPEVEVHREKTKLGRD